jgi:predicted MPP superfamily phosphohydrolase
MIFYAIMLVLFIYTSFKAISLIPDLGLWAIALTAVFFYLMIGWQFIYRKNPKIFHRPWFKTLAWTGSTLLGVWATFVMISLPIDLLYLLFGRWLPLGLQSMVFPLALLMSIAGFLKATLGPRVKRTKVPVNALNADLQGLRLLQISDLHVGPTIRKNFVKKVVEKVNREKPDFVFLTGDIADASFESIQADLAPLADLEARFGVFYVTGNHEYYWGAHALIAEFKKLGMTVLLNESRSVNVGSSKVFVSGISDPVSRDSDVARASAKMNKEDLRILLSHRPGVFQEASSKGYDLMLSGHTHAGQFFPFSLFIPFAHKYYNGLNTHENLKLYVNPGTGYWGPPNRFGVFSEISCLTLEA